MEIQESSSQEHISSVPYSRKKRLTIYMLWAIVTIIIAAGLFTLLRASSASAADPAFTSHQFADVQIQWNIQQYPAVVLENNGFRIELLDSAAQPFADAQVHIKLEMLDMLCGDYDFELRETSPGIYEGDGVPLMPGLWRAIATIQPESGTPFEIRRTLKAVY
ncbi:hypothetical protein ACX1C1_20505 [Paenibacillus sp. strain BS8-2]